MRDRIVSGLIIAIVVWMMVIAGLIGYTIHKNKTPENVDSPVHVPTFQRGDCFNGTWAREVWETFSTPDGIIERVGHSNYLFLLRSSAEKRGGDKYASSMSIATFDKNHVKTVCPETWIKHTHTGGK